MLEPIQSRCAVLRYSKLSDSQLLTRLTEVCTSEDVSFTDDGLEAVIFTSQGDMRQVHLMVHHVRHVMEYCVPYDVGWHYLLGIMLLATY